MAKRYIKNDKAAKAMRKNLVVVGTLPKAKAKVFLKGHTTLVEVGTTPDGLVDIGMKRTDFVVRNMDRLMEIYSTKIAQA